MKLLAMDFSTEAASLALLEDGATRAAATVDAGHRRSQAIFEEAAALLGGAGWRMEDVDAFAAGRGPGSYAGLRVSLTAMQGWALPGGRTIWTVDSAAARAAEIFAGRSDLGRVVAWGTARRGTLWAGLFERGDGVCVRQAGEWKLMPEGERGRDWGGEEWDEAGQTAKAEWVGRLFFAGGASEEIQPIYLHPAVVAAPRFDAEGKPLDRS